MEQLADALPAELAEHGACGMLAFSVSLVSYLCSGCDPLPLSLSSLALCLCVQWGRMLCQLHVQRNLF